jgi:hypothetical protein
MLIDWGYGLFLIWYDGRGDSNTFFSVARIMVCNNDVPHLAAQFGEPSLLAFTAGAGVCVGFRFCVACEGSHLRTFGAARLNSLQAVGGRQVGLSAAFCNVYSVLSRGHSIGVLPAV